GLCAGFGTPVPGGRRKTLPRVRGFRKVIRKWTRVSRPVQTESTSSDFKTVVRQLHSFREFFRPRPVIEIVSQMGQVRTFWFELSDQLQRLINIEMRPVLFDTDAIEDQD